MSPRGEMSLISRYPTLLSPVTIGTLTLPNRVVMAPMGTGYADESHQVTDRLIAYHVARAKGGVGADAVHEAGGRIALQLQHGGRQASPEVIGQQTLSPSAVATGRDRRVPQEMTVKQIREAVRAFADGAWRAKQAGFDGVEVHMAHGYLGCSFLSPYLNQRTDAYGGDTVRRTRFAREIIEAIRRRCGREFPVWCRVSGDEFIEGGGSLAETQRVARLLEEYGYCALHVSACIGETSYYASAPYLVEEGHLLPLAEGVSRTVSVPVIGVGNIRHPEFADEALKRGCCELVALGRQLLADPDWCRKAAEDRAVDIVPCIYCNHACLDHRRSVEGHCECVVNPATGHEIDWPDWPDGPEPRGSRRVLVIGAGPAGIMAAITAARRGHAVTLWEGGPVLGGHVAAKAWADRSHVLDELIYSWAGSLDAAGVEIVWQKRADAESVRAFGADVVIIATGSRPADPNCVLPEGCEGEYVAAADYLRDPEMELERLVAVLGGDELGCLAALELGRRGHDVTIFEREEQLGPGLPNAVRHFLGEQLSQRGIRGLTTCEVMKVANGVVTGLVRGEERREFPLSSIIVALGRESVNEPADLGRQLEIPVHVIGDAKVPRSLHEAIWEGADIGRTI